MAGQLPHWKLRIREPYGSLMGLAILVIVALSLNGPRKLASVFGLVFGELLVRLFAQ